MSRVLSDVNIGNVWIEIVDTDLRQSLLISIERIQGYPSKAEKLSKAQSFYKLKEKAQI